ncbi:MAG TPA: rhodanese-like domain-containing protein [Gammaproteobacteria bacterium]|nr:rhodanese-like domain-containing protein [Gammaproteobacteria bacterium]
MAQLVEFTGNHLLLVAGLLAALAAVMFNELRLRAQGATHVTTADAVRLINKGALVVDVRKPEEFEKGHIVNARNVPLDQMQKGDDAINKQKNKILLAVCADGSSAGRAAGHLRKAGYENTFSLKGGLAGWRADNLPLVK